MAKNNGSTTETIRVISVSVLVQGKWRTFPIAEADDPPQIVFRYSNGHRASVRTGPSQILGCECLEGRILDRGKRKPINETLTPIIPVGPNGDGHT